MSFPVRCMLTSLAVCVFLSGCSKESSVARAAGGGGTESKATKERRAAPDFTLKDSNGTTVHLSDYKGKVVVLDFWATWCGPCKIEIPWFMEFEQQYKDKGFAVLGVSMDEGGWDDVKPYIEQRKINYRILMGTDAVGQAYGGVDSLPTTFLIDRSGRIAASHVGLEKGKNELRDEIDHLLQDQSAASTSRAFVIAPAIVAGAK